MKELAHLIGEGLVGCAEERRENEEKRGGEQQTLGDGFDVLAMRFPDQGFIGYVFSDKIDGCRQRRQGTCGDGIECAFHTG